MVGYNNDESITGIESIDVQAIV